MDFAVPTNHSAKIKESEKLNDGLFESVILGIDFWTRAENKKKMWHVRMMVIRITVDEHETVTKRL